MNTHVNPSITIYKWSVRGSLLHGYVSVMILVVAGVAVSLAGDILLL